MIYPSTASTLMAPVVESDLAWDYIDAWSNIKLCFKKRKVENIFLKVGKRNRQFYIRWARNRIQKEIKKDEHS